MNNKKSENKNLYCLDYQVHINCWFALRFLCMTFLHEPVTEEHYQECLLIVGGVGVLRAILLRLEEEDQGENL